MTEGWGNLIFSVADESGTMSVHSIVDPKGPPTHVLDSEGGFSVSGTLEVPRSLTGVGIVSLAVEEIGGSFNQVVSRSTINMGESSKEGGTVTYDWETAVGEIPKLKGPEPYRMTVSFVMETPTGERPVAAGLDLGIFVID